MCAPGWFVWSAAHTLPRCAVSLTRLIVSKVGGIRRSHSHLKDVLICTDLLKIVFLGTNPNYLSGFGLLLWPRACQANTALLPSLFCATVKHCSAGCFFFLAQMSQILGLDWLVQEGWTNSTFCLKCIYALECWNNSRYCNAANRALLHSAIVNISVCFKQTSSDSKAGLKACHHILCMAASHCLPDLSLST